MDLGTTLFVSGTGSAQYLSSWFARGGNGAFFACEVFHDNGALTFDIEVQTKNSEDDDSLAFTFPAQPITLGTPYKTTSWFAGNDSNSANANPGSSANGLKELVRFRYVLTGTGGVDGLVNYRMLAPQWLPNGS